MNTNFLIAMLLTVATGTLAGALVVTGRGTYFESIVLLVIFAAGLVAGRQSREGEISRLRDFEKDTHTTL